MQLRNYQISAIENIKLNFAKGFKRLILCAPTGAGKTIIFSEIARLTAQKNKKVLIITDRKELLSQTDNKLNHFGIIPMLLTAKTKTLTNNIVVVAMVETVKRRLSQPDYFDFVKSFQLIIIDEAHKCSFNRIFESLNDNQFVIGATATPYRSGKMPELKLFYDKIIEVCTVKDLILQGFLAFPTPYGMNVDLSKISIKNGEFDEIEMQKFYDNEKLYSGIVENYKLHCNNEKTLIFCATIQSSKNLCMELQRNDINSRHFDCYMNDHERSEVLSWFKNTISAVLCNVGILTTGFDCPTVKVIALYRATKSLPLYLQMIGRGSRVTNDKKTFKILDFGNNINRFSMWEDDRIWSLKNDKKPKSKEKKVSPMKNCPECDALIHISTKVCPYCGFEYEEKEEEKSRFFAILQKLTPSQIQRFADSCSVQELEQIRIEKNYKIGWVLHKLKAYNEFLEYEKIKNYKSGWARYQWNQRG